MQTPLSILLQFEIKAPTASLVTSTEKCQKKTPNTYRKHIHLKLGIFPNTQIAMFWCEFLLASLRWQKNLLPLSQKHLSQPRRKSPDTIFSPFFYLFIFFSISSTFFLHLSFLLLFLASHVLGAVSPCFYCKKTSILNCSGNVLDSNVLWWLRLYFFLLKTRLVGHMPGLRQQPEFEVCATATTTTMISTFCCTFCLKRTG